MSEKPSKQETLEKISNCQLRILALEKNRSTHLYSKRHEYRSLYCTLEELDIKFSAERKAKKQELQLEISRIRSNVNAFHRTLLGMQPDPAFVEKLKQMMEGIESSIMVFKEKQREIYESHLLEEQNTAQEITAFERKLDSWMTIPRGTHLKPEGMAAAGSAPVMKPASSSIPPAVVAFELFLQQTGGRQGGWDEYDHQAFLKTRATFTSVSDVFLEAVAKELPTKTVEEIRVHEQWFTEYSSLLESKRRAIEAWRGQKQKERRHPSVTEGVERLSDDVGKSGIQEMLDKEREARFSRLEAWKTEKKLKQVEAEEQRLKMELHASKLREKENQRRAALKSRVEGYTRSKEAELSEQNMREEAKKAQELVERRLANKELELFRQRDMKVVMEKKKKAEAEDAEKLERERKLDLLREQVEVRVQRDPARLYKLTKGWEERKRAAAEIGGGGANNMSLPRRAVPSWRQGM